jgi:hypothetical protein
MGDPLSAAEACARMERIAAYHRIKGREQVRDAVSKLWNGKQI